LTNSLIYVVWDTIRKVKIVSPKRNVSDELEKLKGKGESFHTADELPEEPDVKALQEEIDRTMKEGKDPLDVFKPRTNDDFEELDKRDNDQIIAEMEGKVIKEYFYQFKNQGRIVTGISKAGVMALARDMGDITLELLKQYDDADNFYAIVKAHDGKRNLDSIGASQSAKKNMYYKPPSDNQFALATAITKASRNAIRGLVAEKVITSMYEEWQKKRDIEARQDSP